MESALDQDCGGTRSTTTCGMQEIVPRLFLGELTAAQSLQLLQQHNIGNVVSAIKQSYDSLAQVNYLCVPIDDTERTNICEWFDNVAGWIQAKLDDPNGRGVLVHCIAGVSRSTTLLAAYLMKAHKLTTNEALKFISSKRPQIQPNDFFLHQLEMYERCNCEWDPVKYQEQRRFIMSFVADQMKDGAGPEKLILAYYPSPAPSPLEKTSLAMTPLESICVETKLKSPSSLSGTNTEPPTRRRLTKKTESKVVESKPAVRQPVVEKLGQGQVVIKGRRIRCKMCRRELAAREHILFHSPGQGQAAFGRQKQDMDAFRSQLVLQEAERQQSAELESGRALAEDDLKNLRISLPPRLGSPASAQSPPLCNSKDCSSYFVEPLSWMGSILQNGQMTGKLLCPNAKCLAKLGAFDWAGCQCSCGAWVTPGFQILRSKVDEV